MGIKQVILRLLDKEMRKPRQGKEGLVYLSPVLLWVGIVCTGLFLIPGLVLPLVMGAWTGENFFFLAFAVGSSTLIVGYCNCRIRYTEESFTVKYFLGYRRTFSYSEIESIQGWQRDIKLKVRGCTVRLDEVAVGRREFLDVARKQYRIAHGGKSIPKVEKSKWDPFNGHVDNPGEFIFAYVFLLLFLPATVIVCFFVAKPTPMEEMTFLTAPVEQLWVQEDGKTDLVLSVQGTELEIWGYRDTLSDAEAFLRACEAGEKFAIGYRTVTNDENEVTGYSAEYIEDSAGKVWITPEDARNHRFREVTLIFGILELVWLAYCGISIYIGRNPQKFSKKTIRMFFKDGYVH